MWRTSYAAGDEGIGDEGAVAAPGIRLGAHDRGGRRGGGFQECGQLTGELVGLHVVGVAAEGGLHAGVDRAHARAAEAAKAGCVRVRDAGHGKVARERGAVELRMAA
jgi:hypothetical protein